MRKQPFFKYRILRGSHTVTALKHHYQVDSEDVPAQSLLRSSCGHRNNSETSLAPPPPGEKETAKGLVLEKFDCEEKRDEGDERQEKY